MKISIIVPIYNTEDYLDECILSVLNQTYTNWELILINDGSTDNSEYICSKYKTIYPNKIININNSNQGPFLSRICGINNATGDIVMFLDSDDYLRKDALYIVNECFKTDHSDMVIFNASTEEDFSKSFRNYNFTDLAQFENETKEILYKKIIISSEMNNLATKAVKRYLFENLEGLSNYKNVKHGEDLLQLLPVITKAEKVSLLNQNIYFYRQREGSITHKLDLNRHLSIKTLHQELEKYIELWGLDSYKKYHCTRQVKGWIDTILLLNNNKKEVKNDKYKELIKEMINDSYFRNAYKKMDKKSLSYKHYCIALMLYYKQLYILDIITVVRYIKSWRK